MNCQQVEEQEVIERYLAEKLSEQESAAFEEHFLGCKQCFEELRLHHAAAAEMRQRATPKAPDAAHPVESGLESEFGCGCGSRLGICLGNGPQSWSHPRTPAVQCGSA